MYDFHSREFVSCADEETSETGPTQGTLRVFPDVGLSNAYIILRPFFHPLVDVKSPEIYDAKNWSFGVYLF